MVEKSNKTNKTSKKKEEKKVKIKALKPFASLHGPSLVKGMVATYAESEAKALVESGNAEYFLPNDLPLEDAVARVHHSGGRIEVVDDAKGQDLAALLSRLADAGE